MVIGPIFGIDLKFIKNPILIRISMYMYMYSTCTVYIYIYFVLFSDLCGAVSDPLTISRTVVVGKSASLVCRLLYLLSYFIRCSEIEEQGLFKSFIESQFNFDELEESDIFPDSRDGSSLTLLSESGRSSVPAMSSSLERVEKAPLVKPHPFSIGGRGNSISRASSYGSSLNQSSMTLSCGSLDRLTSCTATPLQVPKPILRHVTDSNSVCQSVPAGMLSNSSYMGRQHSGKEKSGLTPFTCVPTHSPYSTGVVTNLQRRGGGGESGMTSPLLSGYKINTSGGKGGGCECTDCSSGQSNLYSVCPVDTSRILWRPRQGSRGAERRPGSSSPLLNNDWRTRSYDGHTKVNSSLPEKESPGSKLLSESSTDSLSTGYHTTNISRNPSGTSIGLSQQPPVHSRLSKRQGTCSSFDSGVFEHTSILTTDSERLTDFDSLQMSNGSSFRTGSRTGSSFPQQSSSMSLAATGAYPGNDSIPSTSRYCPGAFSFTPSHYQSTSGNELGLSCPHGETVDQEPPVNQSSLLKVDDTHVFSQSYDSQQRKNPSIMLPSSGTAANTSSQFTSNPSSLPQSQSFSSASLKCASSPALSSMAGLPPVIIQSSDESPGSSIPRNNSYKGLPLIDCPELQDQLSPSSNHLNVS